jgi:hypothetical protein
MLADPESLDTHGNHWPTPHEPAWQTIAGCLLLVLSLALLCVVL